MGRGQSSARGRRTRRSSPRCAVVLLWSCLCSLESSGQLVAADLPFVVVDAHEMCLLAGFQQRNTAPDPGVAQDDRRLALGLGGDVVEGVQQGVDVVAVDPLREPTARRPLVDDRFGAQYADSGAV